MKEISRPAEAPPKRSGHFRRLSVALVVAGLLIGFAAYSWQPSPRAGNQGDFIPIEEFSRIIRDFSEEGGYFLSDNFVSNETSYLHVMDKLEEIGSVGEDAYIGVRGIFIGNRLVMTAFNALDPYYAQRHGTAQLVSESAPTEDVGVGSQVLDETQLAERQRAINQARVERFSDVRLQQLVVNTVVYALTQEGPIARPTDP